MKMKTDTGMIETTRLFNQYKCVLTCDSGYYIAHAVSAIKAQNKVLKKFSLHTKGKIKLTLVFKNNVSSFEFHKENKLLARNENAHHWARHAKQVWNSRNKIVSTNGKHYFRNEIMSKQDEKISHSIQLCGMSYKNTGITKPLYRDNGLSKWENHLDNKLWSEKKLQSV